MIPNGAPERLLSRRLRLSRAALAWEHLWPALWPMLCVAGIFIVTALFDLLSLVPGIVHAAILGGFALAFAGAAAYCASKAGLNAFSEALMQEVRHDGIRVSYVMPGSVATGFSNGDESTGADWKISADEVADVVVNLLRHPARSLPSRVELRPTRPPRK